MTCLKDSGRGIIALPTGALFNAVTSDLRKRIVQSGFVECIITLPAGMLSYTAVPISLVIINKNKREESSIQMILTDELFENVSFSRKNLIGGADETIIEKIVKMYHQRESLAGASQFISYEMLAANDWILLPSRYIHTQRLKTEHGTVIVESQEPENWIELKDTGGFYRGITASSFVQAEDEGNYKMINYADIRNGEIQIESLGRYRLKKEFNVGKYLVAPNDIVISCKGSAIKIAIIPEHTEYILLSNNFIGLRLDPERFDAQFVKCYLESPVGQLLIQRRQVGTTITTLNIRDLEQIALPQLSLQEQKIHTKKLIQAENDIQNKMNYLHTQARQVKWDFYQEIGLGKIMKKENLDEN